MSKLKLENKCLSRGALRSGGFTLIEIMVALGLFTIVITISLGSILSIFDANRRAQSSKTIVDNLNYTIESLARTVRFGSNYHCDHNNSNSNLNQPQNCPNGDERLAVTFEGSVIVYRVCPASVGFVIKRSIAGEGRCSDSTMIPITSPDAVIQHAKFYVLGSATGDSNQPYVLVIIQGYVGNKPTAQSNFTIQTMMSQRGYDL